MGGGVEYIWVNFTDPSKEVDGERSSLKTKHPVLADPDVRKAIDLLIDRSSIQKFIYGRTATPAANFIHNPERYRSAKNKVEFSIDKANQLLEQAGWKKAADGVRAKEGRKLKLVFQTSVNQPRQKTQAIIKQACQRAGIDLELKAITGSVFFSTDFTNPDTASKFFCDLEMFTLTVSPDPGETLLYFCSWEVAAKSNKWQGRNLTRWQNDEFDQTYRAAKLELDPVKRAALLIRLNDLVVGDHAVLPIVSRYQVTASTSKLRLQESGWDSSFAFLQDWYREA
jgi:peptide/nickel transport system substrate-binding protein